MDDKFLLSYINHLGKIWNISLSQYKVKGFPTVLIVDGDVTTEYPGKRTASDIMDFLNGN